MGEVAQLLQSKNQEARGKLAQILQSKKVGTDFAELPKGRQVAMAGTVYIY